MTSSALDPARPTWRTVVGSLTRSVAATAGLLVLYAVLPLGVAPAGVVLTLLVVGLAALAALLAWQFLAVGRSRHPGLRAAEALSVAIPLFLLIFASTYYRWSQAVPDAFTEPLTRVDAVYFTVTTFATVGYGDISPVSAGARIVATIQMAADLLLIGLVVNAMVSTARRAHAQRGGRERREPQEVSSVERTT